MTKQYPDQLSLDVLEIEAALKFMKEGRFNVVVFSSLRDAINRIEASMRAIATNPAARRHA